MSRPAFIGRNDGQEPLSPRQQEVATLTAQGMKTALVAETLGIAYWTAADHLKEVYRRWGINSRALLALECQRRGLV